MRKDDSRSCIYIGLYLLPLSISLPLSRTSTTNNHSIITNQQLNQQPHHQHQQTSQQLVLTSYQIIIHDFYQSNKLFYSLYSQSLYSLSMCVSLCLDLCLSLFIGSVSFFFLTATLFILFHQPPHRSQSRVHTQITNL